MNRFPRAIVEAIDRSRILGVRAGARSDHRFTGIWPIVLNDRVFGRSWTRKPDGWFSALLAESVGVIQIGGRRVRMRASRVRSRQILDAMDRAYAAKYPTPASRKYVRGFRTLRRRDASIEFRPR